MVKERRILRSKNKSHLSSPNCFPLEFDLTLLIMTMLYRTISAFSMDVIARCAYGMRIDCLGEKDDPFIRYAQLLVDSPTRRKPVILLPCNVVYKFSTFFPSLACFCVTFFSSYVSEILFAFWREDVHERGIQVFHKYHGKFGSRSR